MDNNVEFELNASEKGWTCTGCGLLIDCIGRPVFGAEMWTVQTRSNNWIENRPEFNFCPKCGKKVRDRHEKKD